MERPKVLILRVPKRRQKPRIGRLTLPRPKPEKAQAPEKAKTPEKAKPMAPKAEER